MARSPRHGGSNEKSRRYHDRVARRYDAIYDDPYWTFHDELTWRLIKPHLPRDATAACADLGCGTGKWGMKLLKSGYPTTFVDHSGAMVEQARLKVEERLAARAKRARFVVGDIADLSDLDAEMFGLQVAMGDPLSICSDPQRAANEMYRTSKPGGVVIATADNKLAALDHYVDRGNLDALEEFVRAGTTRWLTPDEREQFELRTFTPATLRRLFERAGFEVLSIAGKTIIPVRQNKHLLTYPDAVARLIRMEEDLASDPAAVARAGHLQVVARRPLP